MANLALATADTLSIEESIQQATLPAAEAITAGMAVRIDTSSGKFTPANGSTAAEGRVYGIAVKTVAAGFPVTAINRGVVSGYDLDSQSFDDEIFLSDTDGTLADAAGTVSVSVGRVIPIPATTLGNAYDKAVSIEL